jgi:RimJ/RimL family protein N-acetyltransferase
MQMGEHLSDEVVGLRPWQDDDARALVECLSGDEEIARWLDQIPQPYTRADARAFFRREGEEKYAVVEAAGGGLLGGIGLTWHEPDVAETGYWIRREERGRGYTTRALRLAAAHAFASGAQRVHLRADPENAASCRVAEKAGFTREGVLRSAHWNPRLGRRQDYAVYSLLAGELE